VELPLARCKRAAIPRELAPDSSLPHWRDAEVVEMREAVRGDAPNQGTRVRMAWSADEWRILFECDDQLPWATLTERDAPLFSEETVEVFFDPIAVVATKAIGPGTAMRSEWLRRSFPADGLPRLRFRF
jgi:hypothetical protein